MPGLAAFVRELRRRKVVRMAVLYAAGGLAVIQAADLLLPALLLPAWTYRLVVALVLLGFPLAVCFAWAFDLTAEGVRRTRQLPAEDSPGDEVAAGDAGEPPGRRRRRLLAVASLLLACAATGAYLGRDRLFGTRLPAAGGAPLTLAVLPLADLSGGAQEAYFADGLTEDILTQVARVPGLRVISRTSVMQYKGTKLNVRTIGTELGADYVLEGTVRRAGGRVRITAQLIDARKDEHAWAESYDRDMSDIFAVQATIADEVGRALGARLGSRSAGARPRATEDLTAYDYFLRGREYYHGLNDMEAAIELLNKAVALDPDYAPAHAYLARALALSTTVDPPQRRPRSWLDTAEAHARRAIALAPRLPDGYSALGEVFNWQGRVRESITQHRRALALDPSFEWSVVEMGQMNDILGEFDQAAPWYERSLLLNPKIPMQHLTLALIYRHLELYAAAERHVLAEGRLQPEWGWYRYELGVLAALRGDSSAAEARLAELATWLRPKAVRQRFGLDTSGARIDLSSLRASLRVRAFADYLSVSNAAQPWTGTFMQAYAAQAAGDTGEMIRSLRHARDQLVKAGAPMNGINAAPIYRFRAAIHARLNEKEDAIRSLLQWQALGGVSSWAHLEEQQDWRILRGDPRFERIVSETRAKLARMQARVRREVPGVDN